jgi:hypothetical protein
MKSISKYDYDYVYSGFRSVLILYNVYIYIYTDTDTELPDFGVSTKRTRYNQVVLLSIFRHFEIMTYEKTFI